jgi:hypothetical protein
MAHSTSPIGTDIQYRESELRRIPLPETVWKVAGGFLIACVSCLKSARWGVFALFWLLATLRIEAYREFPDSLSTLDFSHSRCPTNRVG